MQVVQSQALRIFDHTALTLLISMPPIIQGRAFFVRSTTTINIAFLKICRSEGVPQAELNLALRAEVANRTQGAGTYAKIGW